MTHHKAFFERIEQHAQSAELMRVCHLYKTSPDNYAFELNGRLKSGLLLDRFAADMHFLTALICAKLAEPITLYRMTSRSEFSVPCIDAIRGEFRYQAFMSTTDVPTRLTSFVPKAEALLLEIECPAGFALAPMDLFPGLDEDEFLLGCGTTFKVLEPPRILSQSEARQYLPTFPYSSLEFLRLEVVRNPPYVNAVNLAAL